MLSMKASVLRFTWPLHTWWSSPRASARSLSRHLAEEGTSFRDLVDETRLGVMGHNIGGAVAIALAAVHHFSMQPHG